MRKTDLIIEESYVKADKDYDGSTGVINLVVDMDLNKENLEIYSCGISSQMLKYDDIWNNYYWNSAGSYFNNDGML